VALVEAARFFGRASVRSLQNHIRSQPSALSDEPGPASTSATATEAS